MFEWILVSVKQIYLENLTSYTIGTFNILHAQVNLLFIFTDILLEVLVTTASLVQNSLCMFCSLDGRRGRSRGQACRVRLPVHVDQIGSGSVDDIIEKAEYLEKKLFYFFQAK